MQLTSKQRHLMVNTVRKGVNKSKVAEIFGVTRKTVYYWWNKAKKERIKKSCHQDPTKDCLTTELVLLEKDSRYKSVIENNNRSLNAWYEKVKSVIMAVVPEKAITKLCRYRVKA